MSYIKTYLQPYETVQPDRLFHHLSIAPDGTGTWNS
jgi:hypothetical protein